MIYQREWASTIYKGFDMSTLRWFRRVFVSSKIAGILNTAVGHAQNFNGVEPFQR